MTIEIDKNVCQGVKCRFSHVDWRNTGWCNVSEENGRLEPVSDGCSVPNKCPYRNLHIIGTDKGDKRKRERK